MPNLERWLFILLGLLAVICLAGAVAIMLTMDRGSISQGGRFYVALGALAVLGAFDVLVRKVLGRRGPIFGTTPLQRRYNLISLIAIVVCAVILIGLALFLP